MKKWNYYNDNDERVCAWVRELIKAGEVPDGEVDSRSITEVKPDDVRDFRQCHWFCGVSGWPLALRWAGLENVPGIWTGSCPCQPFSSAGQRKGVEDERHLWPEFLRLIKACRPGAVFGEQVASSEVVGSQLEASFVDAVSRGDVARANKLAHQLMRSPTLHYQRRWVDGVRADLEAEGYAFRPEVLGAHSVGAPHRRQRLFWVAQSIGRGCDTRCRERSEGEESESRNRQSEQRGGIGGVADLQCAGLEGHAGHERDGNQPGRDGTDAAGSVAEGGGAGGVANTETAERGGEQANHTGRGIAQVGGPSGWSDFDIIPCRDIDKRTGRNKLRRVESGTFPLVARLPGGVVPSGDPSREEAQASGEARIMRLRGYGNSIVPAVAEVFIRAWMEAKGGSL